MILKSKIIYMLNSMSLFALGFYIEVLWVVYRQKRLIEKAQSQLGYLKIITPKDSRSSGKSSFVLRDGKLVESTGTSFQRGAIKTGIDPDDIARHNRLMRRQHFMDRN